MATSTFEYQGRDRAGKLVKGRMQAASQVAVVGRLTTMGCAPIRVNEVRSGGLNREINVSLGALTGGSSARVRLKDLAVMARQLATMVSSGLSLLRALGVLVEQTQSAQLRKVLVAVRGQVEAGESLSSALARHPVFPPLLVSMVRAGEVGGFLDTVLLQVATNLEAEVRLRGKVKAAMTYPVAVFAFAMLAVVGMLVFIVPVFADMFAGAGAELPAPTRVLVALSGAVKVLLPVGLVVLVGAALVWRRVADDPRVRGLVDPLKLRMPVLGALSRKVALSRFARNLGTMLSSGVPILQSLDIVGGTTGNVVLQRAVREAQEGARRGEPLSRPLARHAVFPPMVVQMMAVGEDVGALDTMLLKISDFYDQEVEATTEILTALLEPLMVVVLGILVDGMIIALYLPIFRVFDLMS